MDGKSYKVNLSKHLKQGSNKSGLHLKARAFLKKTFPLHTITEEISIRGFPSGTLYFDLAIVSIGYFFEISGEQHYKFTPFFHKNKLEFLKAQQRDRLKRDWAELNGFTLIEFRFDESEADWKKKLR